MTQPSTAEQFAAFFEQLMQPRDPFQIDPTTTDTQTTAQNEETDQ